MCCDLIRTELIAVDKENITKRNWFIDPCLKKERKITDPQRIQWVLIHLRALMASDYRPLSVKVKPL